MSLNDPQGVLFTDAAPTVADILRNCNLTFNEFMSSELMEVGGKLQFKLIKANWSLTLPTDSILAKMQAQDMPGLPGGLFVRFLDENQLNIAAANLFVVSLSAAMSNMDWKVDWDAGLTADEIAVVRTAEWRAGSTFYTYKKAA